VKPLSADDSVAVCPMKAGCAKLLNLKPDCRNAIGFFMPVLFQYRVK